MRLLDELIYLCSAMEHVAYTAKSFLIGLAVVHKRITVEQAALAARVEVSSQIERWGEVEDCTFCLSDYSACTNVGISTQLTM